MENRFIGLKGGNDVKKTRFVQDYLLYIKMLILLTLC